MHIRTCARNVTEPRTQLSPPWFTPQRGTTCSALLLSPCMYARPPTACRLASRSRHSRPSVNWISSSVADDNCYSTRGRRRGLPFFRYFSAFPCATGERDATVAIKDASPRVQTTRRDSLLSPRERIVRSLLPYRLPPFHRAALAAYFVVSRDHLTSHANGDAPRRLASPPGVARRAACPHVIPFRVTPRRWNTLPRVFSPSELS